MTASEAAYVRELIRRMREVLDDLEARMRGHDEQRPRLTVVK